MAICSGIRGDVLITIQVVLLPATCIITYLIARAMNHVEEWWPYISDSGAYGPESCIFGLLFALYAIATFISVYVRWRIVSNYNMGGYFTPKLNNVGLCLGILASVGILLAANFQETLILPVHFIGASLAFGIGSVYMWLHAFISYHVPSLPGYFKCLCHFRVIVAIITTVCAVLTASLGSVASLMMPANNTKTEVPGSGKWQSWMEGYDLHLASTLLEWALAVFVSVFFLTFVSEFKHFRIGMPVVHPVPVANQDISFSPRRVKSLQSETGFIGPAGDDSENL